MSPTRASAWEEITANPELAFEAYVRMTATIALSGFGIEVSGQTLRNWDSALQLIHYMDDVADSSDKDTTLITLDTVGDILEGPEIAESDIPEAVTSALGRAGIAAAFELRAGLTPEQAARFMRYGEQIIELRDLRSAETSVRDYAVYTRREADLIALMYGSVMQPEEQQHPNYQALMRLFRRGGGAYNIGDSILDLRADRRDGLTDVEPTIANHLRLLVHAVGSIDGEWRSVAKLATKSEVWKSFALPVYAIFKDRSRGGGKTIDMDPKAI